MARILVVDDEAQMRELLCQALEHRSHTVDQAVDGCQALQCLADHQLDFVITDPARKVPDV